MHLNHAKALIRILKWKKSINEKLKHESRKLCHSCLAYVSK